MLCVKIGDVIVNQDSRGGTDFEIKWNSDKVLWWLAFKRASKMIHIMRAGRKASPRSSLVSAQVKRKRLISALVLGFKSCCLLSVRSFLILCLLCILPFPKRVIFRVGQFLISCCVSKSGLIVWYMAWIVAAHSCANFFFCWNKVCIFEFANLNSFGFMPFMCYFWPCANFYTFCMSDSTVDKLQFDEKDLSEIACQVISRHR